MHSERLEGSPNSVPLPSAPANFRLVVFGSTGFIGSAIARHAESGGVAVVRAGRDNAADVDIDEGDLVIGCAIHPHYRSHPYDPQYDLERAAAERAARRGARMVMLSSRRVYPEASRWNASETAPAAGDETLYGKNKARTEGYVTDVLGPRACILRLSNVFGCEYSPAAPGRGSFFGMMLSRLKAEGEVVLDVSGRTRRDFIPVERVAQAILTAGAAGASGVFNLGCGEPQTCEAIAAEVIRGYGSGSLRTTDIVRDEFYLDTTKWTGLFGRPTEPTEVLAAAHRQGECLRHA